MIDRALENLYPAFGAQVARLLSAWNLNHPKHPAHVFEGLRDHRRQAELYAQGRTTPSAVACSHGGQRQALGSCHVHPLGMPVTNAAAGSSWHNFGLAVDVVFDSDPVKPGPQWSWDGKLPWPALGAMAQSMGFEWAGAWRRFPEYPHVQKTYGLQLVEAQELYRVGGLPAVWKAIQGPPV